MLEVYEGTLGGGKSYHAVARALRYLASGGRVYSNIELVREECEKYVLDRWGLELQWEKQYRFLSASDIARLHEVVKGGTREKNVLCILDEIHLYHNARDWATASRGLLQWLTQSRKLFVDVICITQHRNNLDKQWIRLVAKYWRFRDLRKWRMPGLGLRLPFFECLSVELDQDGRTVINKQFERFDKAVFRCYSSEQLFDGVAQGFAGSGLEKIDLRKGKRRKSVKGYIYIALFLVLLCAVGSGVWWIYQRHHNSDAPLSVDSGAAGEVLVHPSPFADDSPSPVPSPSPRRSPWVPCPAWWAKDGLIVGGFSPDDRLTFSGSPDGMTNGLPMYARVRGVPY